MLIKEVPTLAALSFATDRQALVPSLRDNYPAQPHVLCTAHSGDLTRDGAGSFLDTSCVNECSLGVQSMRVFMFSALARIETECVVCAEKMRLRAGDSSAEGGGQVWAGN
eukprot:TRINITY_DN72495_c0_g1_i1.p1 TRINITY_DN72495_c0_g1~~TRINITY_DN72495_c0_g1_i1.p1  ORF type:complete len:110 (-),score=6.47 TRINITY_DN72495_c0_g1_i1:13-342(-)